LSIRHNAQQCHTDEYHFSLHNMGKVTKKCAIFQIITPFLCSAR
jgi:hypothetical protein